MPTSPLTPIYKRVDITKYIKYINKFPYPFQVTIVPVLAKGLENWFVPLNTEDVIKIEKIMIKTMVNLSYHNARQYHYSVLNFSVM
jgi:hypothetical protein